MEENVVKFQEKLKNLVALAKKKKNILEIQEINDAFRDMELGFQLHFFHFINTTMIKFNITILPKLLTPRFLSKTSVTSILSAIRFNIILLKVAN